MQTMRPHRPNISPRRRLLLLVALIVLALYILLPQLGDFRSSWHLVRHPRAGDAGLAVALTFATYVAAAGTYRFL
ncbi:MAG TPA: hypothetical protein VHA37_09705, partial [Candidatus Saccharimonadales bacterium]|nr:hypothetical protein [Candidatus Saccharimonadales bacterium]